MSGLGVRLVRDGERALGDVLGRSPMRSSSGDAQCAHDVAQVDGHRLAARDHRDHLRLDIALRAGRWRGRRARRLGELGIAPFQRVEGLAEAVLGEAAHVRDPLVEERQLVLVGFDDVLVHGTLPRLSEASRDVVLRAAVVRIGEDLLGLALLYKHAEVEERGALRHARGLLHRVRDDDDAEIVAQFVDELLDARRGDRGSARARLVHEDLRG